MNQDHQDQLDKTEHSTTLVTTQREGGQRDATDEHKYKSPANRVLAQPSNNHTVPSHKTLKTTR